MTAAAWRYWSVKEQEVLLEPEAPECHQDDYKAEKGENKKYLICLEYHECKTEPVNLPPVVCDQEEKHEYNRIRDHFKISVKLPSEVNCEDTNTKLCPLEGKKKTVHNYLCEELKDSCPECPDCPCIVLAEITIGADGSIICIDQCYKRKMQNICSHQI